MKLFFLVKNYANILLLLLITRQSQRFFFVKHCNISIRCGNCKNSDSLRIKRLFGENYSISVTQPVLSEQTSCNKG